MTGRFSTKDPQRCAHYARFMKHLTLPQANAVFWLLFFFVLLLMCISAIQHHKAVNIVDVEKGLSPAEKNTRRYRRHVRTKRNHYLGIAALCFVSAIVCVVMECFALFNIEYCDGEDLIQLYWGFWSILQVGSLIAIGGVMVQFWIVMGGVETPSWAVALGTPVLVFAALGWVFRSIGQRIWARVTGREMKDTDSEDSDQEDEKAGRSDHWESQAPTLMQEPQRTRSSSRMGSLRRSSTF